MEENLILNQHWAKNKTTFSRFTQHSVLTSHPSKRVGMAGWEILNQAPQRLYWKRRTESPASCGQHHSLQGLDVSSSQSRSHSSWSNPRESGRSIQGRIFKVSPFPSCHLPPTRWPADADWSQQCFFSCLNFTSMWEVSGVGFPPLASNKPGPHTWNKAHFKSSS